MGALGRFWARFHPGKPVVVVSGLPRSGTSMAMKMLEAGGLALVTDGIRTADEDNPKGYYEFERIKNLNQEKDRTWVKAFRGKGIKIISYLLRSLPPTNRYKVLFMNRDLREVLASQQKMLDRRGETSDTPDERMMALYRKDLRNVRFLLRRRAQFDVLELNYSDVVGDPVASARQVVDFLGMPLDAARMAAVVDGQLYRNRAPSPDRN
ncbi:MAG: sulfotransferase [Acidobacteriota bacterium]